MQLHLAAARCSCMRHCVIRVNSRSAYDAHDGTKNIALDVIIVTIIIIIYYYYYYYY